VRTGPTAAFTALLVLLLASGCSITNRSPVEPKSAVAPDNWSIAPSLYVDPSVAAKDREDLAALIKASADVLASPQFMSGAVALEASYPALYLNDTIRSKSPVYAAGILQVSSPEFAFRAMPVIVGEGALTGYNRPERRWRMRIPPSSLTQWRSADPVMKSCAINTVTHEMSHTLLNRQSSRMAFIDGGSSARPSRQNGTTGSYVVGQLAQCTWLAKQGRIGAGDVAACVPVFFAKPGWFPLSVGKFAVDRCDDFADGRPVRLS